MKFLLICLCTFLLNASVLSSDVTTVWIKLELTKNETLKVKVKPPQASKSKWVYIIPQIIPGTYMKINYVRYYSKFKAYGTDGTPLKLKRKNNFIYINTKAKELDYLEFEVRQSLGEKRIWDAILSCAGTIYTDSSFLLNFQLLTGYFEDYKDSPFEIIISKPDELYGAGSLKNIQRTNEEDVFLANNYAELIDRPMLYARADTSSFKIEDNTFRIAVHAERNGTNAQNLKPAVQRIMYAIDSFSGFTTPDDYHFIFYYADMSRLKGIFKTFGIGSALEHKASSVYYNAERFYYDSLYRELDWIGTHEYLHTIAPLNLHSEKIHHFNFAKPDMSAHIWLYEGVTDYLSSLVNAQSESLQNTMTGDLTLALSFAEKRKLRSMTKSSSNIIRRNMFGFVGKILQLGNFYNKAKLIAFGIDIELLQRSGGEKRLLDVLLQMKEDYKDSFIEDDKLLDVLTEYTYPEMRSYFASYIEGKAMIPYENYFEKLGWIYQAKGMRLPSYGKKMRIYYNFDEKNYYVKKTCPNTLGLKKGYRILAINGTAASLENVRDMRLFTHLYQPQSRNEELVLAVKHKGSEFELKGNAERMDKLKYPRIKVVSIFTEEQEYFRNLYFTNAK